MYEQRPGPAPATAYESGYSQWPMQGASQSGLWKKSFRAAGRSGFRVRGLRPRPGMTKGKVTALPLIQSVQRMQRPHRQVGLGGLNQHREFNFRGGDGENIDLLLGQGLEGLR